MMKVYLVRHGDYESHSPLQGLSPKGAGEIRRTALRLKENGCAPGAEIWHSSKERAFQSARILQDVLGCPVLRKNNGLDPDASPLFILRQLEAEAGERILVSHIPLIPGILAEISHREDMADAAVFPTSAAAVLQWTTSRGWQLLDMIKPAEGRAYDR